MVSTVDELINKIDVYYKQGPEVAILLIKRDLLKMRLTDSKSKPHVSNTNTITTLDIIVQYAPISQQDVVRHFPALSPKTVRRNIDKLLALGSIVKFRQGREVVYSPKKA